MVDLEEIKSPIWNLSTHRTADGFDGDIVERESPTVSSTTLPVVVAPIVLIQTAELS